MNTEVQLYAFYEFYELESGVAPRDSKTAIRVSLQNGHFFGPSCQQGTQLNVSIIFYTVFT